MTFRSETARGAGQGCDDIVAAAKRSAFKEAADIARNLMICRTKVNRDGSIVQQCRTPTAAEISKAILARADALAAAPSSTADGGRTG